MVSRVFDFLLVRLRRRPRPAPSGRRPPHSLKSKTRSSRETHHSMAGHGLLDSDPPPNDEKVFACNKPKPPRSRHPTKQAPAAPSPPSAQPSTQYSAGGSTSAT